MVGHLEPDRELCHQYALFTATLDRSSIKILYWSLFGSNLLILFLASWIYIKGQSVLERCSLQKKKRAKALRMYMLLCALCVVVSAAVVLMEAFALLALQFCAGEDLMPLYWSTWTMLQIGSLIAMVGIILAFLHSLWDSKHPPWALALGTPVLVIAGVLHLLHECTKSRINKMRKRSPGMSRSGPSMSRQDTMETVRETDSSADDLYEKLDVELIGSSIDGGPILRFTGPLPKSMQGQGDILGYSDDERPIVSYRRGTITFATQKNSSAASKEARSSRTEP